MLLFAQVESPNLGHRGCIVQVFRMFSVTPGAPRCGGTVCPAGLQWFEVTIEESEQHQAEREGSKE
jgi:hypothetical protein